MITPVLMPKLGETDTFTFTIEKWLHAEGDSVRKGQSLLVVATDKTSLEVEARAGGTLRRILFKEGESVTVGTAIALIGPAKSAIPKEMCERKLAPVNAPPPLRVSSASAPSTSIVASTSAASAGAQNVRRPEMHDALPPSPVPLPREGPPRISPRARRRARELKVPLQALPLPAVGKRITDREVLAAAEALNAIEATPAAREAAYAKGLALPLPPLAPPYEGGENGGAAHAPLKLKDLEGQQKAQLRVPAERAPMNPLRRAVAENMAYAQQFIPQFSVDMLALASPLLELRHTLQRDWGKRDAPGIDDFFIRAAALVLADDAFKPFRAVLDGGDAVYRGEINIGFAVNVENQGVIAPVVKGADRLSLKQIAQATRELVAKARHKHLNSAEYLGGLMTISNLGMLPVQSFRAIVRPGESAILAIPSPHPRFVFESDGRPRNDRNPQVTMATTWQLSLSADHRIVDGVLAGNFLLKLKSFLECPERLI
jgi:pyruvate dehydrogenase E2 component (dihydrolipoamide acetyltransferase)